MTSQVQRLPPALRLFLIASAVLAGLCILTELVCGLILHLPNPYNWALTPTNELALDLIVFEQKFRYFHHLEFFQVEKQFAFAYPAPAAVLYQLIYSISPMGTRTLLFMFLLGGALFGGAWAVVREAVRRGLSHKSAILFCGLCLLLSYPFAFEAKQANIEFFVWLLIAGGLWLFARGRGMSAAACFAVAGSMKFYPLIYLALFLSRGQAPFLPRRRWKEFAFAAVLLPAITVPSLWLLAPDIGYTWRNLQAGIALFQQKIVLEIVQREIGFDHSLFSLVKCLFRLLNGAAPLGSVLAVYMPVVALTGIALYFLRIQRMPFANQVLALVTCSIVMPPASYDYTLIHLYLPLPLLMMIAIDAARTGRTIPGLNAAFLILAAALAPLSEFIVHGQRFGGQLRSLVLVAILVVALRYPFRGTEELSPIN